MIINTDSVLCLVTRIKVKRWTTFLGILLSYLRMKRQARDVPGLIEIALLTRKNRTVIFISLWENSRAMARFATMVPNHVQSVYNMHQVGAEFWSGAFTLHTVSNRSQPWDQMPTHVPVSVAES